MITNINQSKINWSPSPSEGVFYKWLLLDYQEERVIDLLKVEKGFESAAHRHDVAQASYLISGKAEGLNGNIMTAGTFLFVPAGELHGFKALEECVWHDVFTGRLNFKFEDGRIFDVVPWDSGAKFVLKG